MKTKNFLVSGIVGGIVYFLLGWLFYGFLFKDFFPPQEESM
jgi:xanthine/uracil permease